MYNGQRNNPHGIANDRFKPCLSSKRDRRQKEVLLKTKPFSVGSGLDHTPEVRIPEGGRHYCGGLTLTLRVHAPTHPANFKAQLFSRKNHHVLTYLGGISGTQLSMRPRLGLLSLAPLAFHLLFFVIS